MRITYQKRNGDVFYRIRNTYCPYRIGETTSMGWKILNIEYPFKNKYYSSVEYDILLSKEIKRYKYFLNLKRKISSAYKNMSYCIFILLLIRAFVMIPNNTL